MKRLLLCLLCVLLILPSLSGCAGRELYERLLIHGVGVDREGEGYLVTVRSSVSAGEDGEECYRCRGPSVLAALDQLSLSTGRRPFYAHNYLVVFGRSCAEQGLDDCLDLFLRYYNVRPAVQMYLADDRAEDVLSFEADGKYLPMDELQQLGASSEETGLSLRVTVLEFYNAGHRPGSAALLPVLTPEEDRVRVTGAACFSGDRLAALLDQPETRGYLAAKNRLKSGEAVLLGRSFGQVTVSLTDCQAKLSRAGEAGDPAFSLDLSLRADLSSLDSGRQALSADSYPAIERALADQLEDEVRAMFQKTSRAGCDVLGLGGLLSRRDSATWAALEDSWEERLPGLSLTVQARATVDRLTAS